MSGIYVVLVVCLIIWGGIFFYLIHLNKQIRELKKIFHFKENSED